MACHFALWGVVRATHGLPEYGPQCTVGVLAGTHWGDDSSRVMSHQSANPLWLCRVGGHGRDRGRELSCGLVLWTSYLHALFKQISISTPCLSPSELELPFEGSAPPLNLALCPKGLAGVVSIKGSCTTSAIGRHPTERNHREVEAAIMLRQTSWQRSEVHQKKERESKEHIVLPSRLLRRIRKKP